MFGFRRRKHLSLTPAPVLYFKDGLAAFEYACRFMPRSMDSNSRGRGLLIGYVHGSFTPSEGDDFFDSIAAKGKYFDVSLASDRGPVRIHKCGTILQETAHDMAQLALQKGQVASDFVVHVAPPRQGDLVAVEIGKYDPAYPPNHYLNYFMIVYRLLLEIHPPEHSFRSELEVIFASA
jgi:hypothetical protein